MVARIPASAASGSTGRPLVRSADNGAPSNCDHTPAICAHIVGNLVSGGQARSGCASSRNRSSVDPDRPKHNTNTSSGRATALAGGGGAIEDGPGSRARSGSPAGSAARGTPTNPFAWVHQGSWAGSDGCGSGCSMLASPSSPGAAAGARVRCGQSPAESRGTPRNTGRSDPAAGQPTLPRGGSRQEVAPPLNPPPPTGSLDVPRSMLLKEESPMLTVGLSMGATDGMLGTPGTLLVRPVSRFVAMPVFSGEVIPVLTPESGSVAVPRLILLKLPTPVSI